jgi:hypothetical protein
MVAKLIKMFSAFMKMKVSLLYLQGLVIGPYSEPEALNPHIHTLLLEHPR